MACNKCAYSYVMLDFPFYINAFNVSLVIGRVVIGRVQNITICLSLNSRLLESMLLFLRNTLVLRILEWTKIVNDFKK